MGDSTSGIPHHHGPTRENSLGSMLKRTAESYKESEGKLSSSDKHPHSPGWDMVARNP